MVEVGLVISGSEVTAVSSSNGKSKEIVLPKISNMGGFSWDLFTTTEQKILCILFDGIPHSREQLMTCLPDEEYSNYRTLSNHIQNLRTKLRMIRHDIDCVTKHRKYHYKWVRLLQHSSEL